MLEMSALAGMLAIPAEAVGQESGDQMPERLPVMGSSCFERGVVFVDVSAIAARFDIQIRGREGNAYVTVSPGMSAHELVDAINGFVSWTEVEASVWSTNPFRVSVHALYPGDDRFVTVRQHSASTPIVFAVPVGGVGLHERTDYGCSFGEPACADPGTVFLHTGYNLENQQLGSTILFITSNGGVQSFTFASGSSQSSILGALNTFEAQLGVTAAACPENPQRIALRSNLLGDSAFVSAQQIGGTPPIVAQDAVGGPLGYNMTDNGRSRLRGDANCDRIVNGLDLSTTIGQWGDCPHTQSSCPGDFTGDGAVNINDVLQVIYNWGATD